MLRKECPIANFIFITAENLPASELNYDTYHKRWDTAFASALPTPTMQGVYVQFEEDIFHFTCDERSCQWDTLEQKLSDPVFHSVMMYLPPEYCKKPGKEINYTV